MMKMESGLEVRRVGLAVAGALFNEVGCEAVTSL
jgi:hypothetical protein